MDKKKMILVEELRKRSNASINECKQAVEKSGNDIEKAAALLRNNGFEISAKPVSRIKTTIQIIGFILFAISTIAPGVINVVAPPELNTLSFSQWLLISIIGGTVSTVLMTRSLPWIVGCILLCTSSYFLYWVYYSVIFSTRETFIRIELAVPVILALFIGISAIALLEKIFKTTK